MPDRSETRLKEIIDDELFLKARRAKWRKIRFVFYFAVFLIVLVPPFLPLPFAPEFLHDIFGARFGGLVFASTILLFFFSIIGLFLAVSAEIIVHRRINSRALLEALTIPALLISLFFLFGTIFNDMPQRIAASNAGKRPEEFSNPFLEYKMLDCRQVSEEYDVVFVPAHLTVETEYLAYAPRKKDKTIGYIRGKKYGEDWYLDYRSSVIENDLENCLSQDKMPYR